MEFHAFNPRIQLDDDDEEWLNLPIRGRLEEIPDRGPGGGLGEVVRPDYDYEYDYEESQSSISRQQHLATPQQLSTSDAISLMSSDAPGAPYTTRRIDVADDKPVLIRKPRTVQKVDQEKGKAVERGRSAEKRVTYAELPETGQTPLGIMGHRSRSPIPSSNIEESNIIERKRTRRPNPKYAGVHASWTAEEQPKFPAFHMAFMAGTMIT